MNSSRRSCRSDSPDVADMAEVPGFRVAPGPRPHLLVALSAPQRARALNGFEADVMLTVVEPDAVGKVVWTRAPVDVAVVAPDRLDSAEVVSRTH